MTSDARRPTSLDDPDTGPVPAVIPALTGGIVWSELVREMDEEWAAGHEREKAA